MCGLFGAISFEKLFQTEIDNVLQLGIMSQLRGDDSTGIAIVRRKNNKKISFHYEKDVLPAGDFLARHDVLREIRSGNTLALVGHTRKATCGAINNMNAHPIQEGKIIGCHNGVIEKFAPKKEEEDKLTDSRVLMATINKYGMQEAVTRLADGAYAVTYLDRDARTFNIARNFKRPLSIMFSKDESTIYWASEKDMLVFLKARVGHAEFAEPEYVIPDTLYSFQIGSMKLEKTPLKPYYQANVAYHSVPLIGFRPKPVITPLALPAPEKTTEDVICIGCKKFKKFCSCNQEPIKTGMAYIGYNKQIFKAVDIFRILRHGCITCTQQLSLNSDVRWVSAIAPICSECLRDNFTYHYVIQSFDKLCPGRLIRGTEITTNVKH